MTQQLPPFVEPEWLEAHRDDVVLVEVAAEPSVPGAVHLDVDRDLSAPAGPTTGRHPLPAPEEFAQTLSRAGIGDDDVVVAVDDAGGVMAARLVLMLRATGHRAALLNGRPDDLAGSDPPRPAASFAPRPWPQSLLAQADDVLDPAAVVLDARPHERYLGEPSPLDPQPGHVPGARSLPCRENLDESGRLLPDDVLHGRFARAGVRTGAPVVAYCGSGVTACHDLLVMERLGLGSGRLYVGSWSQYAADPDRPVSLVDEG